MRQGRPGLAEAAGLKPTAPDQEEGGYPGGVPPSFDVFPLAALPGRRFSDGRRSRGGGKVASGGLQGYNGFRSLKSQVPHRETPSRRREPLWACDMQARMYLPAYGRFAQPDPAYQFSADGLNLYSYCSNNPVTRTDPSGMRDTGGTGGDTDYHAPTYDGHNPLMLKPLPEGDYLGPNVMYVGFSIATPNYMYVEGGLRVLLGTSVEPAAAQTNTPGPGSNGAQGQSGNNAGTTFVVFNLNVVFVSSDGNVIPAGLAASLLQGAESFWSGTFGNYTTTADFSNPNAQLVTVAISLGCGISNTDGVGGNNVELYSGGYMARSGSITPYSSADRQMTLDHEFGHVLGATDQYSPSSGLALSGHSNDIMGSVGSASRPLPSTIQQILIFNGVRP